MRGRRGRPQAAVLGLLALLHLVRAFVVGRDVHYVGLLSAVASAITFACAWQAAHEDDDVSLLCGTAAAVSSLCAYAAALWLGLPGHDTTPPTLAVVAVLVVSAVAACVCAMPLFAAAVRRPRRLRTRPHERRVAQAHAAAKRVA
jgi:NhaP-type Na+/H+ or K+/H+ antiporter